MLRRIHNIGQSIYDLFEGEDHLKIDFDKLDLRNRWQEELRNSSSIASLMIYDTYNVGREIFLNNTNMGFVLELAPIIGNSEELEADLRSFVNETMEEGAYIQVLLFADGDVNSELDLMGRIVGEKRVVYLRSCLKIG